MISPAVYSSYASPFFTSALRSVAFCLSYSLLGVHTPKLRIFRTQAYTLRDMGIFATLLTSSAHHNQRRVRREPYPLLVFLLY